MTQTSPGTGARAVDQVLRRLRKLPPPRNGYVIERDLKTPTRDCFTLASNHYAPAAAGQESGTILIRTPYGRGFPVA
jgi:predicted acyl esterase